MIPFIPRFLTLLLAGCSFSGSESDGTVARTGSRHGEPFRPDTGWLLDRDEDGYVSTEYGGEDCNDYDPSINPGVEETWYDGVDANCDEDSDYDADLDGFDHTEYGGFDCDDTDADFHPGTVSDHGGISMAYMCPVPYYMGSSGDDQWFGVDYESRHQVTLTRDFYIGVYEVTQEQFLAYMGYEPSGLGQLQCPVVHVTWHESAAFANAVSEALGLEPCYTCAGVEDDVRCDLASSYESPYHCEGYRLPTEAEWEFAARGGTTTPYSVGEELEKPYDGDVCDEELKMASGHYYLHEIAIYCIYEADQVHPVGQLEPNDWGLYDVHGNAWEWCHDWWDGQDYSDEEAGTDPWGQENGTYRARRGGGFGSYPENVRTATRGNFKPDYDYNGLGLRLARTVSTSKGRDAPSSAPAAAGSDR